MDKILLSGASGFLGKILQNSMSNLGWDVIGMDRININHSLQVDITVPFELDKNMSIDTVIHCAGKAHMIPKTEGEKQAFYKVNYEGTKNLCEAIEKLNIRPKAFIFISTVAVYGKDSGECICEKSPLLGNSHYAKSKIMAEEWLRTWGEKVNITIGILRLPLLVGPNPPGNFGAMLNGIRTGKYLSIGKVDARKSMVWAEDIVTIVPKLVEIGGVYNLTDGYHPTFGELEGKISNGLNKSLPRKIPLSVAKCMAKVGDMLGNKAPINSNKLEKIISTLTFDDTKARQQLGWQPTKVLNRIKDIL